MQKNCESYCKKGWGKRKKQRLFFREVKWGGENEKGAKLFARSWGSREKDDGKMVKRFKES